MEKKGILGVDVGGVVLDFIPYFNTELDFGGNNYLQTPEMKDAISSIKKLNESKFKGNIFVVSKHGKDGPGRILEWLHSKNFFANTGIPENHFFPCAERHEKEGIVRKLGITHFVDDRAEVLEPMVNVVPNLYLFQNLHENKEDFAHVHDKMTFIQSWKDLLSLLLK